MTARSVGRCKVETASPTDGALGAVLAENDGGPLMQRGADKHRGDVFATFAAIRRTDPCLGGGRALFHHFVTASHCAVGVGSNYCFVPALGMGGEYARISGKGGRIIQP